MCQKDWQSTHWEICTSIEGRRTPIEDRSLDAYFPVEQSSGFPYANRRTFPTVKTHPSKLLDTNPNIFIIGHGNFTYFWELVQQTFTFLLDINLCRGDFSFSLLYVPKVLWTWKFGQTSAGSGDFANERETPWPRFGYIYIWQGISPSHCQSCGMLQCCPRELSTKK